MMAWVLVGMAAYYLRALLPQNAYTFLLASVALAAGLHLGWMANVQDQSNRFTWIRAVAGTDRARAGHFAHRELGTSGTRDNVAALFRRLAGNCTAGRQAGYRRFLCRLVLTLR